MCNIHYILWKTWWKHVSTNNNAAQTDTLDFKVIFLEIKLKYFIIITFETNHVYIIWVHFGFIAFNMTHIHPRKIEYARHVKCNSMNRLLRSTIRRLSGHWVFDKWNLSNLYIHHIESIKTYICAQIFVKEIKNNNITTYAYLT